MTTIDVLAQIVAHTDRMMTKEYKQYIQDLKARYEAKLIAHDIQP